MEIGLKLAFFFFMNGFSNFQHHRSPMKMTILVLISG